MARRLKSGKKSETTLRKPLIKMLRDGGALVTPYVGSTMGVSGTADIHVVSVRFSGWIELKAEDTPREPLQEKFIRDCVKRGYPAVFLRLIDTGPSHYSGSLEWEMCTDLYDAEIARASGVNVPTSWFKLPIEGHQGTSLLNQLEVFWARYGRDAFHPERLG